MSPTPSQERSSNQTATPASSKKKKESKPKTYTGYSLYCSEVRKTIVADNPDSKFGEIARIVGKEWQSLPATTKQSWVERAKCSNEETTAKLAEETGELQQDAAASDDGSVRDDRALRSRQGPLTSR